MRKYVISALVICCLVASSVTAFAMDSRITASNYETIIGSQLVRGYGYITSTTSHYTSVRLTSSSGNTIYSERVWGTGKVEAYTDAMAYSSSENYGGAVYYGFDK